MEVDSRSVDHSSFGFKVFVREPSGLEVCAVWIFLPLMKKYVCGVYLALNFHFLQQVVAEHPKP